METENELDIIYQKEFQISNKDQSFFTPKLSFCVTQIMLGLKAGLNNLNIKEIISFTNNHQIWGYLKKGETTFYTVHETLFPSIQIEGKYTREQDGRKKILDIVDSLKDFGRKKLSLYLINGIDQDNHNYELFAIDRNLDSTLLARFTVFELEKEYGIKGQIFTNIVNSFLFSFFDQYGFKLNNYLSDVNVVILPSDLNAEGMRKECLLVQENLLSNSIKTIIDETEKNELEKEEYYRQIGVPFIVRLTPRELGRKECKIYFRLTNESNEVKIGDLCTFISKKMETIDKQMYTLDLSFVLGIIEKKDENEFKCISWCGENDCLINLRKDYHILQPFTQNITGGTCFKCKQKANKIIYAISKKKMK